jgi:hypothetical protein
MKSLLKILLLLIVLLNVLSQEDCGTAAQSCSNNNGGCGGVCWCIDMGGQACIDPRDYM